MAKANKGQVALKQAAPAAPVAPATLESAMGIGAPAAAPVAPTVAPTKLTGTGILAAMAAAPNAPAVLGTLATQDHLARLPASLAGKVASAATGGAQVRIPADMASVRFVVGKPHAAKARAEVVWANLVQAECGKAPRTTAELLAAGAGVQLGLHTIRAYRKRGWLVAA